MDRNISLSVLDHISVASPCSANWDDMVGDDKSRYCPDCHLNVYNLSAMSRTEAEALVLGADGRLCAQFHRRADGTVLTRDCPVGLRAARERISRFVRAAAALLGLAALAAAAAPSHRFGSRLRLSEPFSALCRLLAPAAPPPPPSAVMGRMIRGEVSVPARAPGAAPPTSSETPACSGTPPAAH